MQRYSQSLEQDYILDYFKGKSGTFIDIGASDGVTFSNTRALAETGLFTGILIEPVPKAFDKLKELYKNQKGFYLYNYAITDFNGIKTLNVNQKGVVAGDCGLLSTFHQSEMERFQRITTYDQIQVRCHHWKTALNKWKIKHFSMISMDIENDEMNVLPDIDLSKTQLLVIEHNGSQEKKRQYLECTSKHGMDKVLYESGENLIIVR